MDRCLIGRNFVLASANALEASRWPDAATVAYLIERRLLLQAHCHKCGRSAKFDPTTLPLAPETIVPSPKGRFRCTLRARIAGDLGAA